MKLGIKDGVYTVEQHLPEYSNWVCHLFGSFPNNGINWIPPKGKEPNWFWRKMQYLILGNKWVKKEK